MAQDELVGILGNQPLELDGLRPETLGEKVVKGGQINLYRIVGQTTLVYEESFIVPC
jgi:hypothetical protein